MTCREPEWCLTATWTFIPIALIIAAISLAITIWQGLHQPVYTCDLRVEFPDLTTYLVGLLQGFILGLVVKVGGNGHDPDQSRKERGQSSV